MSKLYLHKYKKEYLKTTKNTIIADIDKLNEYLGYEYEVKSLNQTVGDEDDSTLEEFIPDVDEIGLINSY